MIWKINRKNCVVNFINKSEPPPQKKPQKKQNKKQQQGIKNLKKSCSVHHGRLPGGAGSFGTVVSSCALLWWAVYIILYWRPWKDTVHMKPGSSRPDPYHIAWKHQSTSAKAQKKDLLQISQKHYLIIINTIYFFRLFVTLSSLFYSCMKLLRRKKLAHKNTWLKVHFKSFTCTLQSVRLCYLQYNTALDEVIEGHLSLPLAVELLYQCAVELVR